MYKKVFSFLIVVILLSFSLSSTCFATYNHQYTFSDISQTYCRGIKGDFKLPTLDSKYSSTYYANFMTFEEWLPVNGTNSDWFEIGYMDGAIDPDGDSNFEYYKGFFKAKNINGTYVEAKLSKTATVGTTYTYTIVDVNSQNLYEIYIGSTYFGSFADQVPPHSTSVSCNQGFEVQYDTTSTPTVSATTISNQNVYNTDSTDYDNDGNTTEKIWLPWNIFSVSIYDTYPGASASYNSTNNITTFTTN